MNNADDDELDDAIINNIDSNINNNLNEVDYIDFLNDNIDDDVKPNVDANEDADANENADANAYVDADANEDADANADVDDNNDDVIKNTQDKQKKQNTKNKIVYKVISKKNNKKIFNKKSKLKTK